MAIYFLQNCKLYIAEFNLSSDHSEMALAHSAEVNDITTFGQTFRKRLAGLMNTSLSGRGYVSLGDDEVEDVIANQEFAVANNPVTVCPTTGAAGEVGYMFRAMIAEITLGAPVGQAMAFSVKAENDPGDSGLVRGTVMVPTSAALTATGTGTARQLGAASATQKLYAAMHVTAVSGTNPTLDMVVQSDDAVGFVDPTARITFTQKTAVGSQWATPVSGAITDTWWRLSYTIGGTDDPSFTVIVTVGIQ